MRVMADAEEPQSEIAAMEADHATQETTHKEGNSWELRLRGIKNLLANRYLSSILQVDLLHGAIA